MSFFNQPDFFTVSQLDLENKLILPTKTLYNQAGFQLNALYQDIRSVLIDAHSVIATHSKQVYEHPTETLTAWYDQAATTSAALYAQAHTVVMPVYQTSKAYIQAFLNNPEQVTVATFQPVTDYVSAATEQSGKYLQLFLDNPEQFIVNAFAPITQYLTTLSGDAETILISSYAVLADLFKLLLAQPSETLKALYHNTLSALLDTYFDVISSLLTIVM